ncbi:MULTISPECIES: DUF202 domain-containing protein [Streptomyces]|uniref:DUF202 domain-containing protein n=1 Tax=Streptomyces sp. NBC_00093 TaxID=2975649 RepID=A0AAU2AB84_9ACTN
MSEAGASAVRDPGLQPERTRLAWRRTTLSSTVAAVLAGKTALHGGPSAAGIAVCTVCGALWLAFLAIAHRRIQSLSTTDEDGPQALSARHATAATLCAIALAVCGAALLL